MATTLLSALDRLLEAAQVLSKERKLRKPVQVAERAIGLAFERQGREFLKRLARKRDLFVKEALREATARDLDWEGFWLEVELATVAVLEEPIAAVHRAALEAGIRVAIADLKAEIAFDLENPRAVAFLADRAAERVTMINETTREGLRSLLTKAVDEGRSYGKTAKAIKEQFDGFSGRKPQAHIRSRAHLVAVQEAGEAYCEGNLQVGKELQALGLVIDKAWLTTKDSRVSAVCRGNEAQGWIPIDDAFSSGHDRPLGHVACRCSLLTQRRKEAKEV